MFARKSFSLLGNQPLGDSLIKSCQAQNARACSRKRIFFLGKKIWKGYALNLYFAEIKRPYCRWGGKEPLHERPLGRTYATRVVATEKDSASICSPGGGCSLGSGEEGIFCESAASRNI